MDVKYQIFVSSTYFDLIEERRKVTEAILNLGHIPVGMELFQANDDTQWNYIKRRIANCDYYVLIIAERYGSELDGKSYTQMEYEYAREQGVPTVSFLLRDDARRLWPRDRVEFEKVDKIEAFRALCQKKIVKFWANSDDLAAKVALALIEQMREVPRTGWVRANNAPSEAVLAEVAKLSEERRVLQEKVAFLERAISKDDVPVDIRETIEFLSSKQISSIMSVKPEFDGDLLSLFLEWHKRLAIGTTDWGLYFDFSDKLVDDKIQRAQLIIAEYAALALIDFTFDQRMVFDKIQNERNYKLTDYGKKFVRLAKKWMIERTEESDAL